MSAFSDKKLQKIDAKLDKFRIKNKDSDDRKVTEDVFDNITLKTLYHLSNRGHVDALGGSISTGKEANVFYGMQKDGTEVAIKIFRISSSNFNAMQEYILGDHRFEGVGHNKRDIILAWARKEFQNLTRACEVGVRVPKPFIVERNIVVMEFIGQGGIASPQLRNVKLAPDEAEGILCRIVDYMKLLYQEGDIVHGDLSEYNILIGEDFNPVIIDIGQGVLRSHPMSEEFLRRDVKNIVRFFKKYGIKCTEDEILLVIKEG